MMGNEMLIVNKSDGDPLKTNKQNKDQTHIFILEKN